MALLESAEEHRPTFAVPAGEIRHLTLSAEQKLDYISKLDLFAPILDANYETRPGAGKPIQVRVRDALAQHGEFYEVPAGTIVFQEGNFGEHLFVLLRGRATSSTSYALDAEQVAHVEIDEMRGGDFFGEISALAMNAYLFSVQITEPSFLLLIPQFIAQELVAAQATFRTAIMSKYVSRAVRTLIRRVPMLRFASGADLDRLLAECDLKRFGVGDVIFEEGDSPTDAYVVQDGFVKISRRDGDTQRVLSYLVEGDCFGETGVLTHQPRSASATAMGDAEVLVIPGEQFRAAVKSNPSAQAEANALDYVRKLDADLAANVTFVGQRLQLRAEVMPNLDVLVINENLCVRCDNCVTACAAAHEDGFSRLIRKGVTFDEYLLPTACRSCQDPSCLLCKSGGIKRDKDGDIYFTDSCIGCSGCAQRCPYGNITMIDTDQIGMPAVPTLFDLLLKRDGRKTAAPAPSDQRPKLKKIPVKCDLDKGHLFPACVSNCPTGAIARYRADDLDRLMSGRD
jgi:CRP-like cAMP-binding protein/Fe-S-cluster-containing hydrogenase component 2